jgi:MFS family permease
LVTFSIICSRFLRGFAPVSTEPAFRHEPTYPTTSTAPLGASAAYKWAVVAMLWFVCFFNYADRQSMYSVFPMLQEEFGFDEVQLGWIGSAFMWVYAFGAPIAGFVGDRLRRVHLILGGCLFWSVITALTGWCSRFWHFIAVRALEGFGETFYFPASMSLVSDYHNRRTRSRAMSLHQSSVYIGTIGGGWLGGWFAEYYGWRIGFYFFGLSGFVVALMLYTFLREPKRGAADAALTDASAEHPLSLSDVAPVVFRSPAALLLMAAFLGANFVATMFLTWTPKFLVDKFDFKLAAAGLSGTLFIHLASAVSAPASGVVSDLLARRLPGGRMLIQATGLLVGSLFVFLVGTTANVRTLMLVMTVYGFCKGIYDANIFASLYDFVEPRARASAAGLMNMVGWGGGALGPLWIGLLTKYGPYETKIENTSVAIAWGGAVYLACALLLISAALVSNSRSNRSRMGAPS